MFQLNRLQDFVKIVVWMAVFVFGASALAAPAALTVTSYADLVRFSVQGEVKEFQIQIVSLTGQRVFDSGPINSAALDWTMSNADGRTAANGVYLYMVTIKDNSGNLKKHFGKLALLHGRGLAAPPLVTTPTVSNLNPVQPNWTACANPCADTHQGNLTIQTTGAVSWAFFDSVNQRLGIGTTSPGVSLEVLSNTGIRVIPMTNSASALLFLRSANTPGTGTGHADLQFYDGSTQGFRFLAAFGNVASARYGVLIAYSDRDGNRLPIRFFTSDAAGTLVTGLYQEAGTNAGNVGIGTTTPTAKAHINNASNQPALRIDSSAGTNALEIYNTAASASNPIYRVERATGNVYADGSFNCGLSSGSCFNAGTGADVAERIDAVEPMEAGDVVEIHPDQPGKFRKSQSAISTRVAGIISTAPAVTLGNNFDGSKEQWNNDTRPLLALAGRVPVKVSAKYGAIQVGDLLVSSPIPGYAMKCPKASECIGAVIGKALEPLTEGVGKIEVQVMLR